MMREEVLAGQSLMLVLGPQQWTQQAMHLACAVARDRGTTVEVVKMVAVRHPLLLGDDAGLLAYDQESRHLLQECATTAEDYGVRFHLHVFAYANYINGLASAAEQIDAAMIFVPTFDRPAAIWNRWLLWRLERAAKRPCYSLATPSDQPPQLLAEPAVAATAHLAAGDFPPATYTT